MEAPGAQGERVTVILVIDGIQGFSLSMEGHHPQPTARRSWFKRWIFRLLPLTKAAETGCKGPCGGGTSSAGIGVRSQLDAGLSACLEEGDEALGALCGLPSSGPRSPANGRLATVVGREGAGAMAPSWASGGSSWERSILMVREPSVLMACRLEVTLFQMAQTTFLFSRV